MIAYVGLVGSDGQTFHERLIELMHARNLNPYSLSRRAGLTRNTVKWLVDGTTKTPTLQTAGQLADVLGVSTTYLLHGRDADEEDITTIEQLHAWDMKIAKQRMRYFERILAQQTAMARQPAPVPASLSADELAAVAAATRDMTDAEARAVQSGKPPRGGGSAA